MDTLINKLIRSKRRTIALQITPNGEVVLRSPLHLSLELLARFVNKHEDWIQKKKLALQLKPSSVKKFVEGEKFLYLGKEFELKILKDFPIPIHLDTAFYLSNSALGRAREAFLEWYRKRAEKIIPERVTFYASTFGFCHGKVRISSAKTCWGSCGRKNNLNFCWKVILAPPESLDYLVVHELAHTKERNHGKRFWAEVAKILPDYKARRKWFKEYAYCLDYL